jgi:hypothetical protein
MNYELWSLSMAGFSRQSVFHGLNKDVASLPVINNLYFCILAIYIRIMKKDATGF